MEFRWKDQDSDVIVVSSDAELEEAVRLMKDTGVFRFDVSHSIKATTATPVMEQVTSPVMFNDSVHDGVRCDQCDMYPIIGTLNAQNCFTLFMRIHLTLPPLSYFFFLVLLSWSSFSSTSTSYCLLFILFLYLKHRRSFQMFRP